MKSTNLEEPLLILLLFNAMPAAHTDNTSNNNIVLAAAVVALLAGLGLLGEIIQEADHIRSRNTRRSDVVV